MKRSNLSRMAPASLAAFTLVELLVVLAVLATLMSLLLPALSGAKAGGERINCANNMRQLALAWTLYALDHEDRLPYNLGGTEIKQMLAEGRRYNWANSVLNWELDSDNTNVLLNTRASMGVYVGGAGLIFRCPADRVVSEVQRAAGWPGRSRSISMNAMVGDAGEFNLEGSNANNPQYRQFMKMSEIPSSSGIFVFVEEHPDSINDGYFLNRVYTAEWNDLPASYHRGAANLSFADGHVERRRWIEPSTLRPARPDGAALPLSLDQSEREDFKWLMRRTSIHLEPE